MNPQCRTRPRAWPLLVLSITGLLLWLVAAAQTPAYAADPLNETNWVLLACGERTLGADVVTARFLDGRITGSAGARQYFAAYQVRDDRLAVKRIGTTRDPGAPELTELESVYLKSLEAAATYRLIGQRLEVRNARGELTLIYRARTPFWSRAKAIGPSHDAYENRGQVMVPFRPIAEWLGVTVEYPPGKRTTGYAGAVDLLVGSREAVVNGDKILLSRPPSDGRGEVFVPLSFIVDAFGVKADWFAAEQIVLIRDGTRKAVLYPGDYWHGVIAEAK